MTCCSPAGNVEFVQEQLTHEGELEAAAVDLGKGEFQSDFTISEMKCSACISTLERNLAKIPGIVRVRANLTLKRLSVIWRRDAISPATISRHIEGLGFTPIPFDLAHISTAEQETNKRLLVALGVSGFAAMNIMLLSVSVWSGTDPETTKLFNLISGLIATPAVFIAGQPFFSSAWAALRAKQLNMDVPISLAVLLAFAMSFFQSLTGDGETFFDASVMLLFFLLIGRYLDHLMRRRARDSVEQVSRLTAKGAQIIDEKGELQYKTLSEIRVGDILGIRTGERVPLDAKVISQGAELDCSLVTGEATPVTVEQDDEVVAGSINLSSFVKLEVIREEQQSFIAEIVQLMEAAEGGRSRYIRIADRMARIYAPAVHLLALITGISWIIAGADWQHSIYAAIAVLIITCPCALGLAVPVVHVIAANKLFSRGIMMRDGSALERMAEIDRVFFDKTGTLTTGTAPVYRTEGDRELLPLIKALASKSTHPVSQSLRASLEDTVSADLKDREIVEIEGAGIETKIGGKIIRLGRADWVAELVGSAEPFADASVVCATSNGDWISFDLSETLRQDAVETVAWMKANGLDPVLLSGDRIARAGRLADRLGIGAVFAEKRPQEKVQLINEAAERGEKVLMVGDGLNDVAALSSGHASMTPGSACDIGRLAADFVFLRDSLSAVKTTIEVARFSARLVRQNFGIALVYNCIAVPLAMAGYVTPLFAALAMSLSSIVVISNSMRLTLGDGKERRNTLKSIETATREQLA